METPLEKQQKRQELQQELEELRERFEYEATDELWWILWRLQYKTERILGQSLDSISDLKFDPRKSSYRSLDYVCDNETFEWRFRCGCSYIKQLARDGYASETLAEYIAKMEVPTEGWIRIGKFKGAGYRRKK